MLTQDGSSCDTLGRMIATVRAMAAAGDRTDLRDLWQLLGGSSELPSDDADAGRLVTDLVGGLCGKGESFMAERRAIAKLASTVGVDPEAYPQVEPLEDAIIDALAKRLREKLTAMSSAERHAFFADMVKRMPDDERLTLIEQILDGYEHMDDEARAEFRRQMAKEFDMNESDVAAALVGGAATLIPLLAAKQAGFAMFLWTTKIMFAASSAAGVTVPFTAYALKNQALGWLLGPVGLLVTTALSVGWFGAQTWRRKERFRKLVQVIALCSSWRERTSASAAAS